MSEDRCFSEKRQQPESAAKGKKPYRKPAFRYDQVFETQALACGKTVQTQGQCAPGSQKTS